ncbi:hypothetical protein R6Z07M_013351 [Ovis aries]
MALDGCGGVLELVPTVRCSEKLKRVTTTVDLERLILHWLEARLRFLAREQGPVQEQQGLFHESALRIRWPKYWSLSFSISPSNDYSGLISFRIDWFDLLAVK